MSNYNDKSRLNQLWDELKTNLPEINFDEENDSTADGDAADSDNEYGSTEAIASAKVIL